MNFKRNSIISKDELKFFPQINYRMIICCTEVDKKLVYVCVVVFPVPSLFFIE